MAIVLTKKHSSMYFVKKIKFSIQLVKVVLNSNKAGLLIGLSSAASFFSILLVRLVTQEFSTIEATAYLAIVLQISNFYILPLQNFMYAHVYPKTLNSNFGFSQMLHELKIPYFGLVTAQSIIILSLSPLLKFVFGVEAKSVIGYVILIMVADYAKLLCIAYGFIMIGKGLNKLYFYIQLTSGIMLVFTSIIAHLLNANVCYAFVLYHVFYLLLSFRYAKK